MNYLNASIRGIPRILGAKTKFQIPKKLKFLLYYNERAY